MRKGQSILKDSEMKHKKEHTRLLKQYNAYIAYATKSKGNIAC